MTTTDSNTLAAITEHLDRIDRHLVEIRRLTAPEPRYRTTQVLGADLRPGDRIMVAGEPGPTIEYVGIDRVTRLCMVTLEDRTRRRWSTDTARTVQLVECPAHPGLPQRCGYCDSTGWVTGSTARTIRDSLALVDEKRREAS